MGPELNLLAAVLLQALRDAQGGDQAAAVWLADYGRDLVDEWFGIAPAVWARWPNAAVDEVFRPPINAEWRAAQRRLYFREYRRRRRAAQKGRANETG